MNNYTIPCTAEQTKKALELGAPIDTEAFANDSRPHTTASNPKRHDFIVNCVIPTTQQMIGWLEEQGFNVVIKAQPFKGCRCSRIWISKIYNINSPINYNSYYYIHYKECFSRKEAILAAIDAALDYLIVNKK